MNLRHDPVIHDLNKHLSEIDEAEQDNLKAEAVMSRAEEIAREMITPAGYDDNGVIYNMDDITEHVFSTDDGHDFHTLLADVIFDKDDASRNRMQQFLLKHATAVAEDIAWREAG